jgi:hypothetical protein
LLALVLVRSAAVTVNEGMYRAGPTAPGLPLPRTALGAFTGVVIAVSILAAFFPWLLLLGKGPGDAWRTFREGGLGMWFLALLDFALPVALGIAGAVVVRGKRVPSGLFFGVAVIPFFVSILFGWLALRLVDGALVNGAVDPLLALRIDAAGMSEALALDRFGGFITCGAALIGAVALAGAVASIDVAAAARSDGQQRPASSSVFGAATLVSGAAWLVAILVLTALRIRTVGPICIWMFFVVATLVPLAVFAARAAPVLRTWHDPIEARRAAGGLLVAGLAAMLAVMVFERAILARTGSDVFGAVSGEHIDPSQRARILMELVEARKWTAIAYGIHAVLGGATFALAVAASIGPGRLPISPSTVMAASLGVFVLAATFGLGAARTRSTERIAAQTVNPAPKGVTLPVLAAEVDEVKRGSGVPIVVRADGSSIDELHGSIPCGASSVMVFGDRMATLDMLAKKIGAAPCTLELVFAGSVEIDRTLDMRLGDLAPFARDEVATIGLQYDNRMPSSFPTSGYLTVRAIEDETIEYEGNKVKLPLGPGVPDLRSSRYDLVRYVLRPNDTIGHLLRIVMAMKQRFHAQLGWGTSSRLEIERPVPPPPPSRVRLGTPIVSGRLSPEAITTVFRQNMSKLVACYDSALYDDPKLAGTVVVKLAIDRNGTVTAMHAETTLGFNPIGRCMATAFIGVAFPPPEGGIVTVRYPIEVGR